MTKNYKFQKFELKNYFDIIYKMRLKVEVNKKTYICKKIHRHDRTDRQLR
jgi:hypothetical protein